MAEYTLSQKAIEDLGFIWNYTYDVWSEKQADIYYEMLVKTFHKLAQSNLSGKSYAEIEPDLFGYRVSQHIIFYRKHKTAGIEVIRILHCRMDLKKRIRD